MRLKPNLPEFGPIGDFLMDTIPTYTAFGGHTALLTGTIKEVVAAAKTRWDLGTDTVLVFDDATGKQVDFDFEGSPEEVQEKLWWHPLFRSQEPLMTAKDIGQRGPGRPKLGVVSREISLLPRHWEWLETQPQGASAAIRRLVDEARKREPNEARARKAREAAGNFMWAMAGNLAHFEEASRALYAGDVERLERQIRYWPQDVRAYVYRLLEVEEPTRDPAGFEDGV
jgi:hypothetical protein